jgi:hypothetical protein
VALELVVAAAVLEAAAQQVEVPVSLEVGGK